MPRRHSILRGGCAIIEEWCVAITPRQLNHITISCMRIRWYYIVCGIFIVVILGLEVFMWFIVKSHSHCTKIGFWCVSFCGDHAKAYRILRSLWNRKTLVRHRIYALLISTFTLNCVHRRSDVQFDWVISSDIGRFAFDIFNHSNWCVRANGSPTGRPCLVLLALHPLNRIAFD